MTNKLIEAADELADRFDMVVQDICNDEPAEPNALAAALCALTAYRTARESAVEVKVKPLVWEWYWASTPCGPYSLYEGFKNEAGSWYVCWSGTVIAHAHSLDAAKAAAQADYETRIRSALAE